MTQQVGVLAVRIWRDEDGQIRARVMSKLSVLDPAAALVTHHSTQDSIEEAVTSWVRRYCAHTSCSEGRRS